MSRLTFSLAGVRRRMQMSAATVFAFVEDRRDRYFYGKLCARVFEGSAVRYTIMMARELPGTPGKQGLLDFHEYLRQQTSLCDHFKGKRTVAVFFCDKDVDDALHVQVESAHIFYTDAYSIENLLFCYGDLSDAIASACSLDPQTVQPLVETGSFAWRQAAAAKWKEWVVLCLTTRLHAVACEINYSVAKSPIHNHVSGVCDQAAHAARIAQLTVLVPNMNLRHPEIQAMVDALYEAGEFDKIFSGKWYVHFAIEEARLLGGAAAAGVTAVGDRILDGLQRTVNYAGAWTLRYQVGLTTLLDC